MSVSDAPLSACEQHGWGTECWSKGGLGGAEVEAVPWEGNELEGAGRQYSWPWGCEDAKNNINSKIMLLEQKIRKNKKLMQKT